MNEGQSLGLNCSGNILSEVQNSLSEVDPVIHSGQHIIRIREMKILSCENLLLWLSDEIMERAYQKFLEVGKTKGLFSLARRSSAAQNSFLSAHAALQLAVLRFWVSDKEANSKFKKLCKINEDPTAKID